MKLAKIAATFGVVTLLATGSALAQTTPMATPTPNAMDKKAVSKECSSQADAQKLHGKARKTFRSKCKMMGGKQA